MDWIFEHGRLLLPLAVGWVAVWLLFPKEQGRLRILGGLVGLAVLVLVQQLWLPPASATVLSVMFLVFAATAVTAGTLMITARDAVYSALWFGLVTLSVCGLFLVNAAPFLAAATVIVYGGAIVVTFLFVIMLAKQAGETPYDRHAHAPALASLTAFVLLGAILFTLQEWSEAGSRPGASRFMTIPADAQSLPLSVSRGDLGTLRGVGRSLFGDYLFAVEMAGTVLLIATIGAIALAPRRAQGTL